LAQTPDRLEPERPVVHGQPPSLIKKYLFEPLWEAVKFFLRGLFSFVDFLRSVAFGGEKKGAPLDKESFLEQLRSAPRPADLLRRFEQLYSTEERSQIYKSIGEAHSGKISWKEMIWARTPQENIRLGRRLVAENPFLLRDFLLLKDLAFNLFQA